MSVVRLTMRRVEKPWGRRDLPPAFGAVAAEAEPIGEIWFEDPRGRDPLLLVKYLFTSDKLSIQVHPDDAAAREMGLRNGKDEAWLVLDAEPGAQIGLGLREAVSKEVLRAAALDGTLQDMVEWRAAVAGDSYYSPAGTIHSIGGGLKLIEVQQNMDVTYRLYDFGRPRELHLDEAVGAARSAPYIRPFQPYEKAPGRTILSEGGKFVLERVQGPRTGRVVIDPRRPLWLIPIAGGGRIGTERLRPGGTWMVEGDAYLETGDATDMLIAYPGARVYEYLFRAE